MDLAPNVFLFEQRKMGAITNTANKKKKEECKRMPSFNILGLFQVVLVANRKTKPQPVCV